MHAVGMGLVIGGATFHIAGDDMDLLAADPRIDLIEPDCCAAFCWKEQLGNNEKGFVVPCAALHNHSICAVWLS